MTQAAAEAADAAAEVAAAVEAVAAAAAVVRAAEAEEAEAEAAAAEAEAAEAEAAEAEAAAAEAAAAEAEAALAEAEAAEAEAEAEAEAAAEAQAAKAEAEAEAVEAEAVEAGGCRKGCVWPAAWWGLHATQQAEKELRRAEDQHELAGGEMSREKGQAMGPDLCRTISTRCLPRGHLPQVPPPVGPAVEPVRLRGLGLRGTKRGAARIVLGPIDEGALNPVQQ